MLFLLAAFMFFSPGAVLAGSPIPDLTGKWTAENYSHHHEQRGFFSYLEADGEWLIKEQQGRIFYGERSYTKKQYESSKTKEGFSGVISRDGKRLYIVDHDEDILIGDIVSDGLIELIMINDGDENNFSKIGLLEIKKAK